MEVKIIRKWFSPISSIGLWYFNEQYFCFTLEDTARAAGVKLAGITAIPEGVYNLSITHSIRFKRSMPLISNMQDGSINDGRSSFSGVRVHWGNRPQDTEGCVIVGYKKAIDVISESVVCFNNLFQKIDQELNGIASLPLTIINRQA